MAKRLEEGFDRFKTWCKRHGKSTSIKDFSTKTFKIVQPLNANIFPAYIYNHTYPEYLDFRYLSPQPQAQAIMLA